MIAWLLTLSLSATCPGTAPAWAQDLKAASEETQASVLRRWAYCDAESFALQASVDDKLDAIAWWAHWLRADARRATAAQQARALSRLTDDDDAVVRAHAFAALWAVSIKY